MLIINLKNHEYLGYSDIGFHLVTDCRSHQVTVFKQGKLVSGSTVFFACADGSIEPSYSTVRKASRNPQIAVDIKRTESELSRKRIKGVEEFLRDFYIVKEA